MKLGKDGWPTDESVITMRDKEIKSLRQQLAKSQVFKAYVHQRLDNMGVPHAIPESEHDKAGCRVSGRLDWVEKKLAAIKQQEPVAYRRKKDGLLLDAMLFEWDIAAPEEWEPLYASPQPAIPEGYSIIPDDPQWFLNFVRDWDHFKHIGDQWKTKFFKGLLAAAPQPTGEKK